MAAADSEVADALYNLRLSIKASATPILTTSAEPTPADTVSDLAVATYVSFNDDDGSHRNFALSTPTRFAPDGKPVDLRSCYFAWLNKDASVTDYFAAVQTLNEELPGGAGGSVQNLTFAQKIELLAWLSGETESSDSIAAVDGGALSAAAGDAAAIAGGKGVPVDGGRGGKTNVGGKMMDARLLQIYDGERKMGDHNSVLRGTKNVVRMSSSFLTLANILRLGLLPLPQNSLDIPAQPTLRPKTQLKRAPSIQSPKAAAAKTPPTHHPALPLRILPSTHLQRKNLPQRRRLHPAKRYRFLLHLCQRKHDPNPASAPLHLLPTPHLHPRRQHH
jgi:hypothetical protein